MTVTVQTYARAEHARLQFVDRYLALHNRARQEDVSEEVWRLFESAAMLNQTGRPEAAVNRLDEIERRLDEIVEQRASEAIALITRLNRRSKSGDSTKKRSGIPEHIAQALSAL